MLMQTSANAAALIGVWEGFKPQAYLDTLPKPPVWTIGKGTTRYHNGDYVQPGDEITENEADEEVYWFIRKQIEPAGGEHFAGVDLQPGMRDALASLMYNLINGTNPDKSFPKTKALILAGAPIHEILDEWVTAIYSGGEPHLGLHRRRTCEALVCLGWLYDQAHEATKSIPLDTTWRDVSGYTEPEPADILFENLEIPKQGAPVKLDMSDPTPETPMTMDDRQFLSARAAGYEDSYDEFMGHRTIVTAKNAIKTPNLDTKRAPKPMEDSKTFSGLSKKESGKEAVQWATVLSTTAGTAGVVKGLTENTADTVEAAKPLFIGFNINHLIIIGLFLGVSLLFIGGFRMIRGHYMAKDGREESVQPKA